MEDNANQSQHEETTNRSRISRKHMTPSTRRLIFDYLLCNSKHMVVNKGFKTIVAHKFSVSSQSITRIWAHGKKHMENGINFSGKLVGNVRRKRVHVDVGNKVKAVPFTKRTNIRTLANAIQVSKSTLYRHFQD
ncbi:hypothetical protein POM88_016270 [Heracleum sosnowskyi]|uniref:DUF7769 domain-containing protein n=1 Tax=Heracleum sosnowskyi TaxID=360622 RepID=A0AAD8IPG8_9APIA|nr:hypothetical protein POM88_016270 [Heracleum sosnowskyi]